MTDTRSIAIFDFDKTLVSKDSFRLFGTVWAAGPTERVLLLGYAVLARLGLVTNKRYKELVLERVWQPRDADERAAKTAETTDGLGRLLVTAVVAELRAHLEAGDRVIVLSASPVIYLGPLLAEISPDIEVHGSDIWEAGGRLEVGNLFGDRKAELARNLIAGTTPGSIHVYTDHKHDLELMKLADHVTLVRPKPATVAAVERAGLDFEVLVP
jgi:phosphatidylglycerophosphatase C